MVYYFLPFNPRDDYEYRTTVQAQRTTTTSTSTSLSLWAKTSANTLFLPNQPVSPRHCTDMKLKQLEGLLDSLEQFSNPKIELEQYPTGPHIASRMLYTAENSYEDVSNKVVADFGCGCGTLGLAASLLGAEHVIGLDIDTDSLEIALANAKDLEVEMDFVQCNVVNLKWAGQTIDTIIMNPPFGTRKKGADMDFLSTALKVASGAVYSLHKTTTRDHVKRIAMRDYNARSAEVLCELRFDVPRLYKFHRKKEVDVAVDLWRFVPQNNSNKH